MSVATISGILTVFERLVGFQSPMVSQDDLLFRVKNSKSSGILDGLQSSTVDKIYKFWRKKRSQHTNSLLRQFWTRYTCEDQSQEAIFKSRVPSIIID